MQPNNLSLGQVKIKLGNAGGNDSVRRPEPISAFKSGQVSSFLQSALDNSKNLETQKMDDMAPTSRAASVQQMFMRQQQQENVKQNPSKQASILLNNNLNSQAGEGAMKLLTNDSFLAGPFQPDGSIFSRKSYYDGGSNQQNLKNFMSKDMAHGLDFLNNPALGAADSIQQTTSIQPNAGPTTRLRSFSRQNSVFQAHQPLDGDTPKQQLIGTGLTGYSIRNDPNLNFQMRAHQQQLQQKVAMHVSPPKLLKGKSKELSVKSSVSTRNEAQLLRKRSHREAHESSIAQVRLRQEQIYVQNAVEGKRMRKNKEQMKMLMDEFEKNYKWTYEHSVRIGELIGMTFHQVSKWNWDQRKKRGIPTERIKKPANA